MWTLPFIFPTEHEVLWTSDPKLRSAQSKQRPRPGTAPSGLTQSHPAESETTALSARKSTKLNFQEENGLGPCGGPCQGRQPREPFRGTTLAASGRVPQIEAPVNRPTSLLSSGVGDLYPTFPASHEDALLRCVKSLVGDLPRQLINAWTKGLKNRSQSVVSLSAVASTVVPPPSSLSRIEVFWEIAAEQGCINCEINQIINPWQTAGIITLHFVSVEPYRGVV
ncbi:uncharacterized protein BJX67DRAFT_174139 [Aspergillus lucknowensis]|uniref:Uncharacterized protein n=1 Tax=Aspergillus lucknowensis TaxID=176173 RepID=A0ABR4LME9_9EURO